MKKMIKRGFLGALLCCGILASTAQQLPNYGFESWKSSSGSSIQLDEKSSGWGSNKKYSTTTTERQRPGVEPTDWSGSNVKQVVSIIAAESSNLCTKGASGGVDNSVYAILTNSKVEVAGFGATAPAYLTLGEAKPWVYPGNMGSGADGGTYGGVAFTYRPDAITGYYKRSDNGSEVAHIIVYTWTGEYKSTVATNNTTHTFTNLDRAIMGKTTGNNGEGKTTITQSGTRIAYCDYVIEGTISDWTEITVPLTYDVKDTKPTMMNVVISSADYWTRGNLVEGSKLCVDNVKFLYYSRLSTLNVGGVAVPGFAEGTYNYTINGIMPANPAVGYTVKGMDATAEVITDNVNKTITVVVTNASGADADGATSHTYTIKYNEPKATVESVTPANGATDVKLDAEVSFTTTMALQNAAATVNGAAATVAVDGTAGTITFDKAYSTEYTISLTADNLAEAYTWSFTTVAEPIIEYYNGDLDVDISSLAASDGSTEYGATHVYSCSLIEIHKTKDNDNVCDFYLRNFSFSGMELGDIVVNDVTITNNNGVLSYNGTVTNLIVGGMIDCDVNVRGTEYTDNGKTIMNIDVIWYNMGREVETTLPIYVTFDGQKVVDGLRLYSLSLMGEELVLGDDYMFNFPVDDLLDYAPAIGYTKIDADATVSVEVNHFAVKIWVEKDGKSNFYSFYDDNADFPGVELPAEIEGNLIIEGKRSNDVATKEIAGVERVLGSVIYDMPMIDGTAHYGVGLPFEGGSKYAYTIDGSEYDITDEASRETAYALVYTEEFDTNANGETIWQHTDRFTMAYQRFDLARMAMWGITDDEVTSLRFVSEAGAFGAPVATRAAGTGMDTPALYGMVANNGLTSVSVSELDATASEVYIINAEGTELVKADDVNTATIQPFGMAIVYRGEAAAAPASIAIEESSIATGIEGVTAGDMRVYAAEGNIYVKGYTGEVAIFTINGAQVCTVDVADNATIAMAQGMYIVRTGAQATMVVVK